MHLPFTLTGLLVLSPRVAGAAGAKQLASLHARNGVEQRYGKGVQNLRKVPLSVFLNPCLHIH
jgi:hypothetical protein